MGYWHVSPSKGLCMCVISLSVLTDCYVFSPKYGECHPQSELCSLETTEKPCLFMRHSPTSTAPLYLAFNPSPLLPIASSPIYSTSLSQWVSLSPPASHIPHRSFSLMSQIQIWAPLITHSLGHCGLVFWLGGGIWGWENQGKAKEGEGRQGSRWCGYFLKQWEDVKM